MLLVVGGCTVSAKFDGKIENHSTIRISRIWLVCGITKYALQFHNCTFAQKKLKKINPNSIYINAANGCHKVKSLLIDVKICTYIPYHTIKHHHFYLIKQGLFIPFFLLS